MDGKVTKTAEYTARLSKYARLGNDLLLNELATSADGLSESEAEARLKKFGPNTIAREDRLSAVRRLFGCINNPLVLLLLALGTLSFLTGDHRAAGVISVMVILGVVLRLDRKSVV